MHAQDCPNGGTHNICDENNGRKPVIWDLFECECAERCLQDPGCTVYQYQENRDEGRVGSACFLYDSCENHRKYRSDTWCFKIAAVPGAAPPPTLCGGAEAASDPTVLLDLDAACEESRTYPQVQYLRMVKSSVTHSHCPRIGSMTVKDHTGATVPIAGVTKCGGCAAPEQANPAVWTDNCADHGWILSIGGSCDANPESCDMIVQLGVGQHSVASISMYSVFDSHDGPRGCK